MILGLRHVGIVVYELEAALHFYVDLLGFRVVRHLYESGTAIDKMLDLVNVRVTTVKMEVPGGGMIELLEFASHISDARARKIYHSGPSHIALTVDDVQEEFGRLTWEDVGF